MTKQNKTRPNQLSVKSFLETVDEPRRTECLQLAGLMEKITGEEAVMWGQSIVGFGKYHYKYKSGREGDWFLTGFSPRKQALTIYVHPWFDSYEKMKEELGKLKSGVGCLYVKKLEDIDPVKLEVLIRTSIAQLKT